MVDLMSLDPSWPSSPELAAKAAETTPRPVSEPMRRRFIGSLAGCAAKLVKCDFDAVDQNGCGERLGQEANGSGLQRPVPDALIGEGGDKNKRHVVTPNAQMRQKIQTAHAGHLHICNDT